MANSRSESQLHLAESFVESAGTVLFRLSTREICVLRLLHRDEYVLPKGRRNLAESRAVTATRETTEETGVPCRLLPVNMASRVCPAAATAAEEERDDVPDEVRFFERVCEPIAVQTRRVGGEGGGIKLIWWFVAAVNEDEPVRPHEKDRFGVEFYPYDEALDKLTFQDDRELVKKAIEVVKSTVE